MKLKLKHYLLILFVVISVVKFTLWTTPLSSFAINDLTSASASRGADDEKMRKRWPAKMQRNETVESPFPCHAVHRCIIQVLTPPELNDLNECEKFVENERSELYVGDAWLNFLKLMEASHQQADNVSNQSSMMSVVITRSVMNTWRQRVLRHPLVRLCPLAELLFTSISVPQGGPWHLHATDDTKTLDNCAVVGNSYTLLQRRDGGAIDRHDYVWRMNWAPLNERYWRYAGSRTTHMVVNRVAAYCTRRTPPLSCHTDFDEDVVVLSQSLPCLPLMRSRARAPLKQKESYLLSPTWMQLLFDVLIDDSDPQSDAQPQPSTGMITVLTAMSQCKRVRLYGFGAVGRLIHNYWTPPRFAKAQGFAHEYDAEKEIMSGLMAGQLPRRLQRLNVSWARLDTQTYTDEVIALGERGEEGGPCIRRGQRFVCNDADRLKCDAETRTTCVDVHREKRLRIESRRAKSDLMFSVWRNIPIPLDAHIVEAANQRFVNDTEPHDPLVRSARLLATMGNGDVHADRDLVAYEYEEAEIRAGKIGCRRDDHCNIAEIVEDYLKKRGE